VSESINNNYKLTLTVAIISLFLSSLYFIKDVSVETSYKAFLDADNILLTEMDKIQSEFDSIENSAVIILKHKGGVFQPHAIHDIGELTNLAWKLPFAIKVESLTTAERFGNSGGEIEVRNIIENSESTTTEQVTQIRRWSKASTLVNGRLVSEDETVSTILVEFAYHEENQAAAIQEVGHALYAMTEQFSNAHDVDIFVTGAPIYDYTLNTTMFQDAIINLPAIGLITFILLVLFLRSITLSMIASVITITAVVWSLLRDLTVGPNVLKQ